MAIIVGLIIGVVLGLTGAGGSIFAVPLLILLLDLPMTQAVGLSLAAVAVSSLFGVTAKLKSRQIQWLPALVYAAIGSLLAPVGNWANRQLDETLLLSGFMLLVAVIAARMWVQASKSPTQANVVRAGIEHSEESNTALCKLNNSREFKIGLPCVMGVSSGAILTGFLSGMFGVGGGFLIVPTLLFLTGISMKEAVATSLVVIAAISSSGFISFLLTGYQLDAGLLLMIAAGGVMGMLIGIVSSRHIAGPSLQKTFSVLMIVIGIVTLLDHFL